VAKQPGRGVILCCPVLEWIPLYPQHCVSECYQRLIHVYYNACRNSVFLLQICKLLQLTLSYFHQLGTPNHLSVKSHRNDVTRKSFKH
jgi:hypothetical protein